MMLGMPQTNRLNRNPDNEIELYPSLKPGDHVWVESEPERYTVIKAVRPNGGVILAYPEGSEEYKAKHTYNIHREHIRKARTPEGKPVPRVDAAHADDEPF